ncbi:MAG: HAMP domain-containing protein [Caldilineaceae bacterium]|jgi:signal transduction histidine kinase|nr:HAMP domain-containing protein [Caldilineaceae bacterium]
MSWLPISSNPSIRRRLMAWLGLTTFLMLLITAGSVGYLVHRYEQELWRSRLVEEVGNSAASVEEILLRTERTLAVIGEAIADAPGEQGLPKALLATEPTLVEVVQLDEQGNVLAAAYRDQPVLSSLFTLSQSEWFHRALAGDHYQSRVQYTFEDDPYIILALPGEPSGVVAGRVYLDVLQNAVSNLDLGRTGRVYITDADGEVIAHADHSVIGQQVEYMTQQASDDQRTGIWSGEYQNYLDEEVLGAFSALGGSGWYVIAEITQHEAYTPSRNATLLIVVLMLALAIVMLKSNAAFLKHSVFEPLTHLAEGALRLGQGDLAHRIPDHRNDEIGQITNAFNEMAADLERQNHAVVQKNLALTKEIDSHRQTQEELRILNSSLEERIAERTRELELLATDLTRSNKELQEFAYVASHDLQEPLRKVRAFGDRLAARSRAQLDEVSRDYLTRMENAAERMQALIDALLTYSRVTTQAQPLSAVNLHQVASEVVSDLEIQIERLHGEARIGALDTICADPLQMRQLLQNLIGNALKFHQEDVAPIVHLTGRWLAPGDPHRALHPACNDDVPVYELCVTDNGIGIDAQYTERIFQVFQRLHGRNQYEGTGVGLAICRKIVERHNGIITVQSTPGLGSQFVILLPMMIGNMQSTWKGNESDDADHFAGYNSDR